ncbi:hypothetical protein [Streptomyces sp. CL12]|uniref:hypothetical protein n=1 Tax=Streptomyces sp. CL12 TaxID=3391744 RepID=UPI003A80E54B
MRTSEPPTLRTTGRSRRLPIVTTLAAALCTGMTLLTPVASATPVAAEPVTCETTSRSMPQTPQPGTLGPVGFEGTGTVTCRDAQGEPYLEGSSTFSGTLPSPEATAAGVTPVFRSRVDWSDGTVTTGTFTDFGTRLAENGALEFTINGVNDADSTRFGGYTVVASGESVHVSSDPVEEAVKTQNGKVTYTP